LPAKTQATFPLYKDTIKHHPSIGVAALKEEKVAAYRVWLMCRHLDSAGRGWLDIQLVRQQLTSNESE
jgi:hypothetical protein